MVRQMWKMEPWILPSEVWLELHRLVKIKFVAIHFEVQRKQLHVVHVVRPKNSRFFHLWRFFELLIGLAHGPIRKRDMKTLLSDRYQWFVALVIDQVQPAGGDFVFERCALQRQKNQLCQAEADNLFFDDKILDPRFPLAEKEFRVKIWFFFQVLFEIYCVLNLWNIEVTSTIIIQWNDIRCGHMEGSDSKMTEQSFEIFENLCCHF